MRRTRRGETHGKHNRDSMSKHSVMSSPIMEVSDTCGMQSGIFLVALSGGPDSTLALLVCVRTFDMLGLDRKGIVGITMPGFGTSDRTYTNAVNLMKFLGITIREISIKEACLQHFEDLGHDIRNHKSNYAGKEVHPHDHEIHREQRHLSPAAS